MHKFLELIPAEALHFLGPFFAAVGTWVISGLLVRALERVWRYPTQLIQLLVRVGSGAGPRSQFYRLSGLIPGPKVRKKVRKMLADQEKEIADLIQEKRMNAALWQYLCTWGLFFAYVFTGPIVAVRNTIFPRRSA